MVHRRRARPVVLVALAAAAALAVPTAALAAAAGSTEVTVGSTGTLFSQNKQNEPGLAVDPTNPAVLVAGANDNIDLEYCRAGDPRTCPFTAGVGVSGVQISLDGGATLDPADLHRVLRPRLRSTTDRVHPRTRPGRSGRCPKYYENGMVSNGDPELAFGPQPDAGGRSPGRTARGCTTPTSPRRSPGVRRSRAPPRSPCHAPTTSPAAVAGENDAWMAPVGRHEAEQRAVQRQGADLGRQRRVQPVLRQRLRLQRRVPRQR